MPCGQCIRTDSDPCTYVPDDRITKIHRPQTSLGNAGGSNNDVRSSNQTPAQHQLQLPPTSQPQPQPQSKALAQPRTPAVSVAESCSMEMDMVLSTLDLDVDPFTNILVDNNIDPQLPIVMAAHDSVGEGIYHTSMVQAILQRMQHLETRLSEAQMQAANSLGATMDLSIPAQTSLPTPKHEQSQQLSASDHHKFKGTFVKSRFYAQNHWRASISQVRFDYRGHVIDLNLHAGAWQQA